MDRKPIFSPDKLDWGQFAALGLDREGLEASGHLDTLLRGGQVGPLTLNFPYQGVDMVMQATLRLAVGDLGVVLQAASVGQPAPDPDFVPED